MDHYLLEVEGEQLKLRIRTRDLKELRLRLGDGFMDMFQDEKKMMNVQESLPALLYLALKGFEKENGTRSYDDTCTLVDKLVDAGWSTEQFVELVTGIGEVSGFFPKGTLAQLKAEQAEELARKKSEEMNSNGAA